MVMTGVEMVVAAGGKNKKKIVWEKIWKGKKISQKLNASFWFSVQIIEENQTVQKV